MQDTPEQAMLRRLRTMVSADESLQIPETEPLLGREPVDHEVEGDLLDVDESTGQVEQYSVVDLDIAFASPESIGDLLRQRRQQPACYPPTFGIPLMYIHRGSLSSASSGQLESALKRQPRPLSNRLRYFGRKARSSMAELRGRQPDPGEGPSVRKTLHTLQSSSVVAQASGSVGDLDEAFDSVFSTDSPSPVGPLLEDSGSVIMSSDLEDSDEESDDDYDDYPGRAGICRHLYKAPRLNRLAKEIQKAVYKAFDYGFFEDYTRELRFEAALGNNTSEEEQWAASAQHVQAVVKSMAEVDEAFANAHAQQVHSEGEGAHREGCEEQHSEEKDLGSGFNGERVRRRSAFRELLDDDQCEEKSTNDLTLTA